ncbi:hypothetical protein NR800_20620 [Corallococcus interemptor]
MWNDGGSLHPGWAHHAFLSEMSAALHGCCPRVPEGDGGGEGAGSRRPRPETPIP